MRSSITTAGAEWKEKRVSRKGVAGVGKVKGKGGLGGDKFKCNIVCGMNALPVVPTGTSTFNDPAAFVTTTSSVSRKIGEEVP
jgi:hypothetical protein